VLDLLLSETKVVSKTRPTSLNQTTLQQEDTPQNNPKNTVLSISSIVQKGRKGLFFLHDFLGKLFHIFRWQVLISESPVKNLWHSSLRIRTLLLPAPFPTRTPFLSDTALTKSTPVVHRFSWTRGHRSGDQSFSRCSRSMTGTGGGFEHQRKIAKHRRVHQNWKNLPQTMFGVKRNNNLSCQPPIDEY